MALRNTFRLASSTTWTWSLLSWTSFLSLKPSQKQETPSLIEQISEIRLPLRSYWCGLTCSIGTISSLPTSLCTGESLKLRLLRLPVSQWYSYFCSQHLETLWWFWMTAATTTISFTKNTSRHPYLTPWWTSTCCPLVNFTRIDSGFSLRIK